ncbi:MAG: glycoside hydrolase family 88 protein [Bacteroidaceae bacterium]|nr:glycoside hydrolase family 88 protein [Bacteroidaceae bacterium]
MRTRLLLFILPVFFLACRQEQAFDADRQLQYCHQQVERALVALRDSTYNYDFSMMPRNILEGDTIWNLRKAKPEEWCSGFWAGVLWMDYEYKVKNDRVKSEKYDCEKLKEVAEGYTEALIPVVEAPVYDHDLGFITINSFLKGYEVTKNDRYREVALRAADSLATLFNPTVGTILSWPRHVKDYGGHNTIMDNMMNLELLFWADHDSIAVRHAETTMKHHFREDGSCYHVAVYDTLDGHFIKGVTHQGYADSSMWSRGQAWAIYGYTMVYRYTHDQRFLDFAQKVTDIYLKRLRETSDDWVPYWDMDIPEVKNEQTTRQLVNSFTRQLLGLKDASAACVVASALLELYQYVGGEKATTYREAAINMLLDLSTDRYQSRDRNVAFLMHSTGHHPAGSEIDASIIYADYYYIEALSRYNKLSLNSKL